MRDAEKDLAMCEAATPGPWQVQRKNGDFVQLAKGVVVGTTENNLHFISEAREALPHWIKLAVAAEKEARRFREALEKVDIHIRSTSDPVPYIIETLKSTLPEYKDWWDIGE
ncbi:hypothetical protein ACI7RC_26220 [Brevibacillus sp. B_LB10_24]|uniref:hypothetical protein n=1 Tax=Brevibacillus TaxID=55080 RepID=UPI00030E62A3|nr:hypothetical protein [Brevibacillus massiliensis]